MHCHWLLVMLALIVCRASALSLPKAALQSRVALRSSRSFSRHLAKAVPALNDEGGIDTDPPKRKTRTSKVSSSSGASGASEASTPGKAGTSAASHFSNRFDTLGSRLSSLQEGIHCTIFGEPVSLARHRVTRFGRMYNPSAPLQASFLKAFSPYIPPTPFAGPVAVRLDFYMSRLKKHYGTGKKANVLKENADSWHTKKPGTWSLRLSLFAFVCSRLLTSSDCIALSCRCGQFGQVRIGCSQRASLRRRLSSGVPVHK